MYVIEIRTATGSPHHYDWEPLADSPLDSYPTLTEAIQSILDLILDVEEAVYHGDMSEPYRWEDFRVTHNGNVVASFPEI